MPDNPLFDFDGPFPLGMKSDGDPGLLPKGYYWNGLNIINQGGVISCRPGHRCIVKFPKGKLQGAAIFYPRAGLEQMLVCIAGIVYVSPYPFNNFRILPNILMSADAKQVFFKLTTQSARRVSPDFSSIIEVIDPRAVIFIQDGGITAPAWFDGSNSGHVRDNLFETPIGGPMAWAGDRLWVANRNRLFASDIANPFSFREQIYLGGNDAFYFNDEITALAKTPSLDFPQLVVYTSSNASVVKANIRDRSLWPTTDGMQVETFQIGCASQRSIVLHQGELTWFNQSGIVFYNAAMVAKISSHMPIRDNEMMVSKSLLSPDLSLVAGAAFGPYLLMSVPAEDSFNKHTWCLNGAPIQSFAGESGEAWAGIWTGTRPVEWLYGNIFGRERIYHVSTDVDEENRLWESFTEERMDNGCPITWAVETRGHFGLTSDAKKLPGSNCRYGYTDVSLSGVEEELDIGVFYAGGTRGAYKNIMAKKISVERGSLRFDQEINMTSQLFAYKPQARKERTQDANQQSTSLDTGSCPVESEEIENLDESIQLLIVGHGPASIRWIRSFAFDTPEDRSGDNKACVDETPYNLVRFDGAGVRSEDLTDASTLLAAAPVSHFTSVKTAVVTQDGLTAVGVGMAESVTTQEAADRVAERIATRQAETELILALPPTLSVGEGFDE